MKRDRLPLALILVGMAHAQEALPVFQRVSGLPHAVVLRRIPADGTRDLVVALASAGVCEPAPRPCWWSTKDRIGILLLDRSDNQKMTALAIAPGPNDDCSTRVERFTLVELVLSCTGEKWSTYDNQKFEFDVTAGKLVRHSAYAPFSSQGVLRGRNGPQFVLKNAQRTLLVAIDSATGAPRVIPTENVPEPANDASVSFGPGGRFRLIQRRNKYGSEYPSITDGSKDYDFPRTDRETWRKARPDDAATYFHLDQAEMNEQIGPHQVVDGTLWFGKTFYNSEGATGLGGFGYFDTTTLSYHLIAPPEIYAWSVSAMLVEPDAIWLALYRRGEYGNDPGGLLRWDRKAAIVERWDMPWIATCMARDGEEIYLGATDGMVSFHGGQLRSYFADRMADGRYQIVAR